MTFKDHPLLSTFLCIALVITMLPLIGGAGPAAARGAGIRDIQSGDVIFVYETDLDLTSVGDPLGIPTALVMLDNRTGAEINRIPVPDFASFDVLPSRVGGDYGPYYAANASGVNPGRYVQIAMPEATLGVVLSDSHASVDGKSISPTSSIAFRIASPKVGSSYVTDAGVAEGQLGLEITTPSGAKIQQLGGVSLSPLNVSGAEQFTGAIPLKGVEPGTYSARAKWITPDWQNRANLDSNTVTFTVQPGSTAMVTFSGQVTDTAGKALPNIWVYFWRQDGRKSFYVMTGADGKYSAQVEKSSSLSQRYNLAANKDNGDPTHPKNSQYATAEITNMAPTMNRAGLNFRLANGLVTLGGRVTNYYGKPLADIWVYFWRQDGNDAGYVKTNATGYYIRQVSRYPSTDKLHRYNIAANKDNGDPTHPKDRSFGTKELVNIVPDMNRLNLNFKLAPSR